LRENHSHAKAQRTQRRWQTLQNFGAGRFTDKADETFAAFNRSFDFDMRLLEADVRASIAHANGLQRAGVLTTDETDAITGGLRTILELATSDPEYLSSDAEDVHEFIETRLVELIGDTAKKLHTGRSRNDQVATAFRLWLRDETNELIESTRDLQRELVSTAERHFSAVMPGYTHLQRAQPILWAHWCLAYFEMLSRDVARLADALKRVNVLPLGSGALAGASFAIDREAVAKELGFNGVTANSLDAVSDRDFAIEFVGACSLIMVHLSRMAEDLILYSSSEFGFVTLSDAVSTGSSLMPQKKNPDALELIRGKAGRVFGHHAALLTTMKGLPLAYNKDMQEDKEAVFDTVDTVRSSLNVAAIVVKNISVNESKTREAAAKGYLNATELADYLVKRGVPFRTAHETVGKIVLHGLETGRELHEMPIEELRKFSSELDGEVFGALGLESALASKSHIGGTSPRRVAEALSAAKRSLDGTK
jgi:argininosuccinate lyase